MKKLNKKSYSKYCKILDEYLLEAFEKFNDRIDGHSHYEVHAMVFPSVISRLVGSHFVEHFNSNEKSIKEYLDMYEKSIYNHTLNLETEGES